MSTLGDLLAEHTMLPGNAVDHLHAVVGEWQLLADLSFADYLMWVRRDDDMLVCVAQCRPNTAPTVMQTDAVGSVVTADRAPLVAEAFAAATSGVLVRESDAAQQDSRQLPGPHVAASPVRYGEQVVAVLTQHQTELAAERNSGHLETAYRACANGSSAHARGGHISRRAGRGHVALHPARRRRLHPPRCQRCRRLRQPQRPVGLPPDGPDQRAGRPQPGRGHPAADLRLLRGAGGGRARAGPAGRRQEHADGGRRRRRHGAAADAAAGGARSQRRCRGTDPRRHRGEAPGPGFDLQGRHDPGNPPPREEQPADRGGAVAPAGPPDRQRRGARGADRVGAPGVVDRVGPRRVVDVGGRAGEPRRGHRPDPADHERRGVGGQADPDQSGGRSRRAGLRPCDGADHGDHRACAERDRACIRPGGPRRDR